MPLAATMKQNLSAEQTGRGMSPNLWGDCPIASIKEGTVVGRHFYDDFDGPCPNTDAGLYEGAGESPGLGYLFYGDTGVTIKAQAGVEEGVAEVAGNNADNDESVMSTGSPSFNVSDTAADVKKAWFEARVKQATIDNNMIALFIGWAWDHGDGVSVAKTTCLTDDDGTLGGFSFLGYHIDCANGDAIDFVVKAEGQSATVIKAGIEVPVADTWMKLGFKYDPDEVAAQRIKLYVNNVIQSTYVTATQIAAATFPDAEPMAMVWAVKNGDANSAEHKAQMDWWRSAQLG